MTKPKFETPNMTQKNIDKISQLFPNCITESKDKNGKLKKAVNFELLQQMLSDEIADKDEAYEFTWVGKKAAIIEANKPIRKTLRPCKEESVKKGELNKIRKFFCIPKELTDYDTDFHYTMDDMNAIIK